MFDVVVGLFSHMLWGLPRVEREMDVQLAYIQVLSERSRHSCFYLYLYSRGKFYIYIFIDIRCIRYLLNDLVTNLAVKHETHSLVWDWEVRRHLMTNLLFNNSCKYLKNYSWILVYIYLSIKMVRAAHTIMFF